MRDLTHPLTPVWRGSLICVIWRVTWRVPQATWDQKGNPLLQVRLGESLLPAQNLLPKARQKHHDHLCFSNQKHVGIIFQSPAKLEPLGKSDTNLGSRLGSFRLTWLRFWFSNWPKQKKKKVCFTKLGFRWKTWKDIKILYCIKNLLPKRQRCLPLLSVPPLVARTTPHTRRLWKLVTASLGHLNSTFNQNSILSVSPFGACAAHGGTPKLS